jgi:hypothetical protein
MARLMALERAVFLNTMALLLVRWRDGAVVCMFAIVVAGLLRSWAQQKPIALVAGFTVVAVAGCGMRAAHALHHRLQLQAEEGILAAEALTPSARQGYLLAMHGVIALCLVGVAALMDLRLAPVAAAIYALAAALGHGAAHVVFPWAEALLKRQGSARPLLQPLPEKDAALSAGLSAAAACTVALLAGRLWLPADQRWLTALSVFPALLILLRADEQLIRFQALSGNSALRSVLLHLRPLLWFAATVVAAAFVLSGVKGGALTALACLLGAVWAAMQVMVSRVHRKPMSEFALLLSAILIGGSVTLNPLLPPLAAILVLWRWHGPAQERTWLLA